MLDEFLVAIGAGVKMAKLAYRISFCKATTLEGIHYLFKHMTEILEQPNATSQAAERRVFGSNG